jgi:hypothetical protein
VRNGVDDGEEEAARRTGQRIDSRGARRANAHP